MASTLKMGSRGDEVINLQNMLNQQGYNLTVDGIFGAQTQAAVKQYQQARGLAVDGIVGANTWGALTGGGGASGSVSGSVSGGIDLEALYANLQRGGGYTPLSDNQIRQQAENKYNPIFNQSKLSAQQAYETASLALQQQLEALAPTYDKQRETTAQAFSQARSNADRQALTRGMQRSSYNAATLGNIDIAGAKAQDEIGAAQVRDENAINQKKALNATQLAQYIRQLETDYETNIAAYSDAIRDRDYDRAAAARSEANALELELARLSQSNYQWAAEFAENQRQFNQSLAASKRSGSSAASTVPQATQNIMPSLGDYLAGLTSEDPLTKKKPTAVTGGGGGKWTGRTL